MIKYICSINYNSQQLVASQSLTLIKCALAHDIAVNIHVFTFIFFEDVFVSPIIEFD